MAKDSSNSSKQAAKRPEPAQELRKLSIRHVIMSRGRSRTMMTHKMFPAATLVVPQSEEQAYAPFALETVTVPDELSGVSALRNWIIDRFEDNVVVMLDDDLSACMCMVSLKVRRLSPEEMAAMVENTAYCAHGAGARLFGWHQRSDPRLLQRNDPFGVNHWVGGAVGVIGKKVRWDELLKCKCDIDATMTELMENRLVWNEARFCFLQERDKNLGGNSLIRSAERIAAEKRYLKNKWKAHIRFESYKSQDRVSMDAPRRQSVSLG